MHFSFIVLVDKNDLHVHRLYCFTNAASLLANASVRHPFSIFHVQLPEGVPGVFMRHVEGRPNISCAGTTTVSARRL